MTMLTSSVSGAQCSHIFQRLQDSAAEGFTPVAPGTGKDQLVSSLRAVTAALLPQIELLLCLKSVSKYLLCPCIRVTACFILSRIILGFLTAPPHHHQCLLRFACFLKCALRCKVQVQHRTFTFLLAAE